MNHSGTFKRIRVRHPYAQCMESHRVDDIRRLQDVMLAHGYYASSEQCEELWEMVSEDMCASWLVMPENDDELFIEVKVYFETVE